MQGERAHGGLQDERAAGSRQDARPLLVGSRIDGQRRQRTDRTRQIEDTPRGGGVLGHNLASQVIIDNGERKRIRVWNWSWHSPVFPIDRNASSDWTDKQG